MNRATRARDDRPPPRVRHEPPTIEEAIAAAEGLTDSAEQQAIIAAQLMGLGIDEVRPHVLMAHSKALGPPPSPPLIGAASGPDRKRSFEVERRGLGARKGGGAERARISGRVGPR